MDLLIPKGNEKELLARAKRLGAKEVIFLKEFKSYEEIKHYAATNIGLLITNKKDLNKIKDLRHKVKLVVIISDGSEEMNRAIVETKGVDYVFNLATASGRDHTHYRRGGVNQVIAKLMKENGIKYGISFSRFLEESGWKRVLLLGRWLFNCKVLKKYRVPVEVFSLASDPWLIRNKNMLEAFERIIQ